LRLKAGAGQSLAGLLRRLSSPDALSLTRPHSVSRGSKHLVRASRCGQSLRCGFMPLVQDPLPFSLDTEPPRPGAALIAARQKARLTALDGRPRDVKQRARSLSALSPDEATETYLHIGNSRGVYCWMIAYRSGCSNTCPPDVCLPPYFRMLRRTANNLDYGVSSRCNDCTRRRQGKIDLGWSM
jgi:hypothetical protein